MSFDICPRVKKYSATAGEFYFETWRVFAVSQSELFFSSMAIFRPEAAIEKCGYKEANVRISVSADFSPFPEYCTIRIRERVIEIHCADRLGARNAAAILAQMMRKRDGGYVLPCGDIEDWPDAQYRGVMEESSGRVWTPMETLRRHIREAGLCRYNVYMFHFMEDIGCTVPLRSAPNLRGYGPDNLKYTRQQIEEMIAYAAALGLRVIPFIEVLSHAYDFAVSEGITCPGDDNPEEIFDVCLGQEKTFEVIERVIGEVAELFPDDVIHIGADEYDMSRAISATAHWDQCPHCLAVAKKNGFKTLREMFMYGLQRINEITNAAGKIMMIWNADLRPGHIPDWLDRNILIHYYRDCNNLGREDIYNLNINGYAADGFSVINSLARATYMVDPNRHMDTFKLYSWTYRTVPFVNPESYGKVPGGCLCIWEDHEHYRRTVAPAIALFGDRLWNAHTGAATYDDQYGKVLTHLVFDGKLPEGTNVYACIGDVLPPISACPGFLRMVSADMETLVHVRDLLRAGAEDELFEAYANAIDWIIEEKSKPEALNAPSDRITFTD